MLNFQIQMEGLVMCESNIGLSLDYFRTCYTNSKYTESTSHIFAITMLAIKYATP